MPPPVDASVPVYLRAERVADAAVHLAGIAFGVAAAIVLVLLAFDTPGAHLPAILVYLVGLLAMLSLSGAYNLAAPSRAKLLLRRLDHSAIFLMIAATYTPFLSLNSACRPLLAAIWLTALVGIVLKLLWPGRFERLAILLYLALGWSGVVAYRWIGPQLPDLTLILIASGGAFYSLGVVFHVWGRLRFQNAIWHAHVLLAAIIHFGAVLSCMLISPAASL